MENSIPISGRSNQEHVSAQTGMQTWTTAAEAANIVEAHMSPGTASKTLEGLWQVKVARPACAQMLMSYHKVSTLKAQDVLQIFLHKLLIAGQKCCACLGIIAFIRTSVLQCVKLRENCANSYSAASSI